MLNANRHEYGTYQFPSVSNIHLSRVRFKTSDELFIFVFIECGLLFPTSTYTSQANLTERLKM